MSLHGYKSKYCKALWTGLPIQQAELLRRSVSVEVAADQGRPIIQRTKLRAVSLNRPKSASTYPAQARAYVVAAVVRGEVCPVVATIPELEKHSLTVSDQVHHIYGRGHGGRGPLLLDQRLWLAVSAIGHQWIDANKEQAREYGWLAPKGKYNSAVPASAIVVRNQWKGVEVKA